MTDTPDAIGFTEIFQQQFDALLQILSSGKAGGHSRDFCVFRQTRDFQQVPATVPLTNTARFFGQLCDVYTILFHVLGGETRLTGVKTGNDDVVYVRSCLRTLFLMSKQVRADLWETPMFEEELKKATAHLATSSTTYQQAQDCIRKLRAMILDPKTATLKIDLALSNPRSLGTRKSCACSMWSTQL